MRQLGDCYLRRGPALLVATVNANHAEDTMPVNSRPRRIRPNTAPAYYLGRPASLWISVTTGHMEVPDGLR